MSTIEWGPERQHDGSNKCPADTRNAPYMVKGPEWEPWRTVDAYYRLPADVPAPADPVRDALVEALYECEDYFDNRADADCDQDGFIPNKEMLMLSVVRAALALAKGEKP